MRYNMIARRKELGLTQEDVAKHIGVVRTTVSSYETGSLTPSLCVAIKIKEILKTNDDNIFLNRNAI